MPYLFFAVVLVVSTLQAATPQDALNALQKHNSAILLQEENRLKYLDRQQQNNSFIEAEEYTVDQNRSKDTFCFDISTIELHQNKVLSDSVFKVLFSSYANTCLGVKDLSDLTKKATNLYIEAGYVTSRVYLKEQDLNSGHLNLYVLEGKIKFILLNGKKEHMLATAFPGLEGKVLSLRDLEMGLEQLQRLPTNKAHLTLEAADEAGYTNVNIINDVERPFYANLSISNTGNESTGRNVGNATFFLDDILGLNEQLMLNVNGTLTQKDTKKTKGYGFSFSLPYGYWNFSFGSRLYEFRSTLYTPNNKLISSGISEIHYGDLKYMFYRDATSKADIKVQLDLKQNYNFISNTLVQVSSSKLSSARVFAHYVKNFGLSTLSLTFGMHKGLTLFDPLLNSDDITRKAQYSKYTAEFNYNHLFQLFQQNLSFNNSTLYQYSPNKLYAPEQIAIGGFYTVRGFDTLTYIGEIGGYTRNDISLQSPTRLFGYPLLLIAFAGVDAGVVEYDIDIYKWLVGSSVGMHLKYWDFTTSLAVDTPISAYNILPNHRPIVSLKQQFYF